MKKPPSLLRKIVREIQLDLSAGVLLLILYSSITTEVAFHLDLPPLSGVVLVLVQFLIFRGALLVAAPALAYGGVYAFELNPYAMGIGPIVFVELALLYMMWTNGRFDEGTESLISYVPLWVGSALIAGLSVFAGRKGRAARQREDSAKVPAPKPLLADAPVQAVAQARSFEEQMRDAAAQARSVPTAPAPEPVAPPPEKPVDAPGVAATDKPVEPS